MYDPTPRLDFEPTAGGQRLVLPRRRPGKGSAITLLFGALFAGVPAYGIAYPAWLDFQRTGQWSNLLPILFCLPFIFIGLSLTLTALGLNLRRTALTLEGDELIVRDAIGPFGLVGISRRQHADRIAGFSVQRGTTSTNRGPKKSMKNWAILVAKLEDPQAQPFLVAVGYPHELLLQLAEVLADHFNTSGRLGPERSLPVTLDPL